MRLWFVFLNLSQMFECSVLWSWRLLMNLWKFILNIFLEMCIHVHPFVASVCCYKCAFSHSIVYTLLFFSYCFVCLTIRLINSLSLSSQQQKQHSMAVCGRAHFTVSFKHGIFKIWWIFLVMLKQNKEKFNSNIWTVCAAGHWIIDDTDAYIHPNYWTV